MTRAEALAETEALVAQYHELAAALTPAPGEETTMRVPTVVMRRYVELLRVGAEQLLAIATSVK